MGWWSSYQRTRRLRSQIGREFYKTVCSEYPETFTHSAAPYQAAVARIAERDAGGLTLQLRLLLLRRSNNHTKGPVVPMPDARGNQ